MADIRGTALQRSLAPSVAEGLAELNGLYAALGIRQDLLDAAARAAVAEDTPVQQQTAFSGAASSGAGAMPHGPGQAVLGPAVNTEPAPALGSSLGLSRGPGGSSLGRRPSAAAPDVPSRPLLGGGPGRAGTGAHAANAAAMPSVPSLGRGPGGIQAAAPRAVPAAPPAPAVSNISLADLTSPPPKQAGLGSRQPGEQPQQEQQWPLVNHALAQAAAAVAAAAAGVQVPASMPLPPPMPLPVDLQQLLKAAASVPAQGLSGQGQGQGGAPAGQAAVLVRTVTSSAQPAPASPPANRQRAGTVVSSAAKPRIDGFKSPAGKAGLRSSASGSTGQLTQLSTGRYKAEESALRDGINALGKSGSGGHAHASAGPAARAPVSMDITILPAPGLGGSSLGMSMRRDVDGQGKPLSTAQLFDREQRRVALLAEISVSGQGQAAGEGQAGPSSPGGVRVGSIEVRRCDTGSETAFALAHRFVAKHGSHGLGPEHVARIAKAIQRGLEAHLKAEGRAEDEARRKAGSEAVEAFRGRTTVAHPFELKTDELAESRTKAAQELAQSQPPIGAQSRGPAQQEALAASSASTAQPAAVDVNARRGRLLAKLHVEISAGKSGVIAVRSGDDPKALVASFAKAYGLRDGPLLDGVLEAVRAKVDQEKEALAREQLAGLGGAAVSSSAAASSWQALGSHSHSISSSSGAGSASIAAAESALAQAEAAERMLRQELNATPLPPAGARSLAPFPEAPPLPGPPSTSGAGAAAAINVDMGSPRGPAFHSAGSSRSVTILPQAPQRQATVEGPFGEKLPALPSPDKAPRPTTMGKRPHVNMWFEGQGTAQAPAPVPAVAPVAPPSATRPGARSHSSSALGRSSQSAAAQQAATAALARPSSRMKSVGRGRGRTVRGGGMQDIASSSMMDSPATVIIMEDGDDEQGHVWGLASKPRGRQTRPMASASPRRSSSQRRFETEGPRSPAVQEVFGLRAGQRVASAQGQRAASVQSRRGGTEDMQKKPQAKTGPVSLPASVVAAALHRSNSNRRMASPGPLSRPGSSMAQRRDGPQDRAYDRRDSSSTLSTARDVVEQQAYPVAGRSVSSFRQLGDMAVPQPVIVIRRPSGAGQPQQPMSASEISPKYERLMPTTTTSPTADRARVTALTMREGLRRDAFDRAQSGQARHGAIPLPLTLNPGVPSTYPPALGSPVSTGQGRARGLIQLRGYRPVSSPEDRLDGESLVISPESQQHYGHMTSPQSHDEEDEDEDDGLDASRLTEAQRRLLAKTLTPGAGYVAQPSRGQQGPAPAVRQEQKGGQQTRGVAAMSNRRPAVEVAPSPVPVDAASPPSVGPAGGASLGRPLFNLDVDIGGGRKGRIVVRQGADVESMAESFVATHALPPAVIPKLQALISGAMKAQEDKAAAKAQAKA